jgi:hypothetical protein
MSLSLRHALRSSVVKTGRKSNSDCADAKLRGRAIAHNGVPMTEARVTEEPRDRETITRGSVVAARGAIPSPTITHQDLIIVLRQAPAAVQYLANLHKSILRTRASSAQAAPILFIPHQQTDDRPPDPPAVHRIPSRMPWLTAVQSVQALPRSSASRRATPPQ